MGDTEADKLEGEPGGVTRGVFDWDASRILGNMPGLDAAMITIPSKNRANS